MRDIAAEVGIRASSIYHHFSGKQELFDALVQKANDVKNSLQVVFMNALSKAGTVEEEAFAQTGVFFVTGYLQNAQVAPLLKVLECERFHNEDDIAAEELAAEYQAAILLAYFSGDIKRLEAQLHHFYKRVFIQGSHK